MAEDKVILKSIMKKWMVFLIIALVIASACVWALSRSDLITGTLNVTVDVHVVQDTGSYGYYSYNYYLYVDGEMMATGYYSPSYYSSYSEDLSFSVQIPVNRQHEVWVENSQGDESDRQLVQVSYAEETDMELVIGNAAKVTVEITLDNYTYASYGNYDYVSLEIDGSLVQSEIPYSSYMTFEIYVDIDEIHSFIATYKNETVSENIMIDEYEMTVELTIGD